jgi:PAS domain S-box-containing protein
MKIDSALISAIFNSSKDAILSTDLEGLIQSWNSGAEEVFGFKSSDVVGKSATEILVPDWLRPEHHSKVELIKNNSQTVLKETYRLHKTGKLVPVEVSASPLKSASGEIIGIAAIYRDITEFANSRKQFRDQIAFTETLLQSSVDCVKLLDGSGSVQYVNQNGCELLELDDLEVVRGKDWLSFWPDKAKPLVKNSVEAAQHGKNSRFEASSLTFKGNQRWWDVSVTPIKNEDDTVVQIIASSRDITGKKLVESQLQDTSRRLWQASNAAGLTYMVIDLDTDEISEASNYSEVTGTRIIRTAGHSCSSPNIARWFLPNVVPQDRDKFLTAMKRLEAGETTGNVEFGLFGEDDIERIFDCRWQVEPDSGGKKGRVFATLFETTDERKNEQQIRFLMREVNHRSKNLLSVILAVGRHTMRTTDPSVFMSKFSERINALSSSHDLLVKGEWRGVSLTSLVESQLDHFRDIIGYRIHITGLPLVLNAAAAQGIGMALHELSTNAAKYGSLSNETGTVSVEWNVTGTEHPQLNMSWIERGGPDIKKQPASKSGFGSIVTGRMLESVTQGKTDSKLADDGYQWSLQTPMKKIVQTTTFSADFLGSE